VAFDATVLGLVAGIGGLVVGKLRRRWYESCSKPWRRTNEAAAPRKRLRLYSRLDARFDDRDEDPRAAWSTWWT
jgi:biopolymer transport protein ExbB/TolQ